MSKVVFVGNVPYNMAEEQLISVFRSVGQVIGFRLVFDRDTSKPKGYGFCEFADHETAMSAVRNLNNVDVGGRPLRIDLADSDPFLEGKTTVRGEILDGGYPGPSEPRSQWRTNRDADSFLAHLPPGIQIPKGASSLDSISQTLASMPPHQLMEVLAQTKAFVINHPEQARTLLVKHPQLSYALFQALLLNKIVDSAILERMLASSRGSAPAPGPPQQQNAGRMPMPPPHLQQQQQHQQMHGNYPPFPPQGMYGAQQMLPPQQPPQQLQQQQYYRPPPPGQQVPPATVPVPVMQQQQPALVAPVAPAAAPAQTSGTAGLEGMSEQQRMMLMQVLNLPQAQIDAMADTERNAILQLRTQYANLAL